MYLIGAAVLGGLVGWYMRRFSCNQEIAEMQSIIDDKQNDIATHQDKIKQISSQLNESEIRNRNYKSELAQQTGELNLMTTRWQSTLSKSKQLPQYQSWLRKVQSMYQNACAERNKYSNLASHYSQLHEDANQKIKRLNTRVTAQEAYMLRLQDMISKVRRLNDRVTTSENDIHGLYGWITQVQNKWRNDRIDAANLRELHPKLEEQKNQAQWRLAELDKKYTEQFSMQDAEHQEKIAAMQKRVDELTPLEGNQPGQDTKFNRFMDKIRLAGTSKNTVLGRTYKQIEEIKLESSEKERVFVDTCEEKDAIIEDLRDQVRTADNRAQAACSTALQESKTRISELEKEVDALNGSASMLEEHKHTIEALKLKLEQIQAASKSKPAKTKPAAKPKVAAKTSSKPAAGLKAPAQGLDILAAQVRDDLKLIKGIGPVMEKKLNEFGVYSFEQLGRLTNSASEALSETLESFPGRIKRDKWVSQAKTQHKKKYGESLG